MGWRSWRDHLLGDPAVRARIGRLPMGRQIASRHADRLFGVVAGFVESQLLAAALELGIFDGLAGGPRPWQGLTDLPERGAESLRQGLIATGLIEERGDDVALTIDGLVVASDSGLRAMIAHNRLLYADLADPVATLRGDRESRIARFWPYAGSGDPAAYSELMAASSGMAIEALLDSGVLAKSRHVTDVGGGRGAFLLALRRRRADLVLTLADLPAVVERLDLSADRIAVEGPPPGDPLPRGADTITLIRVLHDQDDEGAAALLRRVAEALPAHGRLVIAEPMARLGRDPQTAYFAAYFAAMASGRLRTVEEVDRLAQAAGFGRLRSSPSGPLIKILRWTKL